jgi:hypothetical protein
MKRLTYSNVVATLALVFAMSGGALAAQHYILTSTSQIKPSVLKALRAPSKPGAAGTNGSVGPAGQTGAQGATGAMGAQGPAGPVTVDQAKSAYLIRKTSHGSATALCHEGDVATGGHAQFDPVSPEPEAVRKAHEVKTEDFLTPGEGGSAEPAKPPTGYFGSLGQIENPPNGEITVSVVCLKVAP